MVPSARIQPGWPRLRVADLCPPAVDALVVGIDAMLALSDGVGLDVPDAKDTLLDALRWMLTGALVELPHAD